MRENFRMKLNNKIAQGSFGSVYQGSYMSHKNCAIKKIPIQSNSESFNRYSESEWKTLQNIKQKNIINIYGVCKSQHNIYIAMEYCKGKDLGTILDHCNFINEPLVKKWMKDLIKSLDYLKDLNIIHRDIKPTNILLTSNKLTSAEVKLVDFGFATKLDHSLKYSKVGTPLYMAPEVMNENGYDYKADIWSLGIVMYELLYGCHPFNVNNMRELMDSQRRPIDYKKHSNVSEDAIKVMKSMIQYDSSERMDYEDLLRLPFFVTNKKEISGSDEEKKESENEEDKSSIGLIGNHCVRKSENSSFELIGKSDSEVNEEKFAEGFIELPENKPEESIVNQGGNLVYGQDSRLGQNLETNDFAIDIKEVYSQFYDLKNRAELAFSYNEVALNFCKNRFPYIQKCIILFVDYQSFLIEEDLKILKIYLDEEIFNYQIDEVSVFIRNMRLSQLQILDEFAKEKDQITKEVLERKIKEDLESLMNLDKNSFDFDNILDICKLTIKFIAPDNEEIDKILESAKPNI